jgi:RHH-type rel operon transcriptional repressor/antitoxin RelB
MKQIVSLRLPEETITRLDTMAKLTGRSKTFYMQQAITEKLQDMEDLYLAQQIDAKIESGEEKT